MKAVEEIGMEVELPRENNWTKPGVGKDKKTGKACYISGLKMVISSTHS